MVSEEQIAEHLQNNGTAETLPRWRLFLMRIVYFLTFTGLVYENWSIILFPKEQLEILPGVAHSFWAAYSLLMGIGMRFPVKMLPLIMLQLLYKTAWIVGTYIPAKSSGIVIDNLELFFWIFLVTIILDLFAIPWQFVYVNYLKGFFSLKVFKKT